MNPLLVPAAGDTASKLGDLVLGLVVFFGIFFVLLLVGSFFKGRIGEKVQAATFVGPTLLFIAIGLVYPAVLTIRRSFYSGKFFDLDFGVGKSKAQFVGLDNFKALFTDPDLLEVLRNTFFWVVLVPFLATGIGLLYAILIDRAKGEAFAKALIFLPMAISMVGATLIWKFVYFYNGSPDATQIGILNATAQALHLPTRDFLGDFPLNTFWLIVIMVWIQAGFAMTVLSAAIKAIPDDILEAANMDGVTGLQMFWFITLPSIRSSVIVVLTTIAIATLKAFDVVQASSGGKLHDSVLANEFYQRSFVTQQPGLGAAIAIVIFLLVTPIIIFNVVQFRKDA